MKIICIGRNYVDHAKELNNPVPKKPLVFMKPSSALLVNNKPFYHPEFSEDVHYEIEVVLKMCKNGKSVDPKFAHTYYDKISVGIDFTARDLQRKCKEKGHPWEIAKAFDNSAVIGKWVDAKNFNPKDLGFHLEVNGEKRQIGNTKDLIFPFDYLISYVSKYFKLNVGDLIYTGTPAGVGPVKIGDELKGFIGDELLLSCEVR